MLHFLQSASVSLQLAHPTAVWKVMGSILGHYRVIAKDVKSAVVPTATSQMHDINSMSMGGMPWPQTGATQYLAQLGLPEKGRAIKGFVVCNS